MSRNFYRVLVAVLLVAGLVQGYPNRLLVNKLAEIEATAALDGWVYFEFED